MLTTHLILFFFNAGGSSSGGMVKRRRGKYEIIIDGQKFVAKTVPALTEMVKAYRRSQAHEPPKAAQAPRKALVRRTAPSPAIAATLPPIVPRETVPAAIQVPLPIPGAPEAIAAFERQREAEMIDLAARLAAEAAAKAEREADEDDIVSLLMIVGAA